MNPSKEAALADVLSQNVEAAEQIKSASNELDVVHAVLSSQSSASQADEDLQAAVERTDEISEQLAETAEALDKSNQRLRELSEGADVPAAKTTTSA